MINAVNRYGKLVAVIVVVLAAFSWSSVQAQDSYSFVIFSNQFDARQDDAYYLVISDPVRNWYNLSEEQQEEWKTDFRVAANRQSGKELVSKSRSLTPYRGSWEAFPSKGKAQEAIQEAVNKFKKDYEGYDKPVKVIYVNLHRY